MRVRSRGWGGADLRDDDLLLVLQEARDLEATGEGLGQVGRADNAMGEGLGQDLRCQTVAWFWGGGVCEGQDAGQWRDVEDVPWRRRWAMRVILQSRGL
jgi:hypothetical protein